LLAIIAKIYRSLRPEGGTAKCDVCHAGLRSRCFCEDHPYLERLAKIARRSKRPKTRAPADRPLGALGFCGFKITRVTWVKGLWYQPGTDDQERTSKRTCRSHSDRQKNRGSIPGYSWRACFTKRLKRLANCLARFWQTGEAEEESTHGL
jgi:hypothetical protein